MFAPEADISWIADTKVVTIEPHDDFGSHFGLEVRGITPGGVPLFHCLASIAACLCFADNPRFLLQGVTGRIDAAFATSNHVRAMENEHAVFISPSLLPAEAPAR